MHFDFFTRTNHVLPWLSMSFREPKVQKSRQGATGILVTLRGPRRVEGNLAKRELWPLFYAIGPPVPAVGMVRVILLGWARPLCLFYP
jgi:hypothetical protein